MRRALLLLSLLALAPAARAGTPAAGVPSPERRGLFLDLNMGTFFTAGGSDPEGRVGLSVAQPYLQLGAGYDFAERFSAGLSLGLGASSNGCFAERDARGFCVADPRVPELRRVGLADNFTATMLAADLSFRHRLAARLTLQPRLLLGYAFLDPEPVLDAAGEPVHGAPLVGGALGLEYATRMDHFSVGVDVSARLLLGPDLPAFALHPKVKYTF